MLYNLFAFIYLLGPVFGLWFIFKKVNIAPWKSLIPVYNIILWIKVCGKDWKWYIYFLIPAINIFTYLMLVVETAKVFNRHNFWEQTFAVIFPFVYMPFLGLSKLEYLDPAKNENVKYSSGREWLDAIVFALIAAVIIRGYCFEFYKIPSSSMEKSLLVGDYLMVSKVAYGPRVSMTPLSFPLVHNVLPFTGGQVESYLKWIKLPYHRYPGLRSVRRFDATVFNYPDGDTVCTAFQSNASYHDLVREYGRETVKSNPSVFGKIVARPVDKKENFIKRCIGLPGETIEIRDQQVLIDGKQIENPKDMQFNYAVQIKTGFDAWSTFKSVGVSDEDCENSLGPIFLFLNERQLEVALKYREKLRIEPMSYINDDSCRLVRISPALDLFGSQPVSKILGKMEEELILNGVPASYFSLQAMTPIFTVPLTEEKRQMLLNNGCVESIMPLSEVAGYSGTKLFPHVEGYSWSVDNFGPVTIPSKGMTMQLNCENIELYRRAIVNFEGNSLEVKDGKIIINGKETTSYTFKMNYYWMMGDNRHNSADSRYWGFVPEDHIVGRASMVMFSHDGDSRKARWNRIFKMKL
ncbi:MAG: signal peptidase I [Bacteroidales bacterium]|nr:signal peptidase I [Bacteroidales bacterium]